MSTAVLMMGRWDRSLNTSGEEICERQRAPRGTEPAGFSWRKRRERREGRGSERETGVETSQGRPIRISTSKRRGGERD
jgi:hypothetical protein